METLATCSRRGASRPDRSPAARQQYATLSCTSLGSTVDRDSVNIILDKIMDKMLILASHPWAACALDAGRAREDALAAAIPLPPSLFLSLSRVVFVPNACAQERGFGIGIASSLHPWAA